MLDDNQGENPTGKTITYKKRGDESAHLISRGGDDSFNIDIYLMNDEGKTVDKYHVQAPQPEDKELKA